MAYGQIAQSVEQEPIELYRFVVGVKTWNFTTHTEVVTIGQTEYLPAAIERGSTTNTGQATKANMEIKIARDTTLADVFRIQPPSVPVTITIWQYNNNDPDVQFDLRAVVVWKGRVVNAKWNPDQTLSLTTESVFTSLQRTGAARKYSRYCTHTLFDTGCQLRRALFRTVTTVNSMVGATITCNHGKTDTTPSTEQWWNHELKWFIGGWAEWENSETGNREYRAIIGQTPNSVTLAAHPLGLAPGQQIELFPGCDHSFDTCRTKFNNALNFGGQPYIPTKNPFGSSPIFYGGSK